MTMKFFTTLKKGYQFGVNKKSVPYKGSFPLVNKTTTLFMKVTKQHN